MLSFLPSLRILAFGECASKNADRWLCLAGDTLAIQPFTGRNLDRSVPKVHAGWGEI